MISVVYDRRGLFLSMEGHANSAPHGQDTICAAASMLAYTLSDAVERLQEQGLCDEALTELSPGRARIGCVPRLGYRALVRLVFDSICGGFQLLAEGHEEFLSFELENASCF